MSEANKTTAAAPASTGSSTHYEANAIYQEGKIVARVEGTEIREDAREVHFGEIHTSDDLMLPEECDFQKYRLMIQRIGYAARTDKDAPEKGRVLRQVVAEILGYREQ